MAILVSAALTGLSVGTAVGGHATASSSAAATPDRSSGPAGSNAGPPYTYVTVLNGQFRLIPLRDKGMLMRTKHGYRFRTGGQSSHLVVTQVAGGLRFVDTGTKYFKKLTPACHRRKVSVGIAAVCRVPANISVRRPLLIEVWPRLGHDFTDTSTLPATFAVTVLADAGNDVAYLGAGPDFFNGAMGNDRVSGGGGNDWIRSGPGNDTIDGGPGNDYIVAQAGKDSVQGGTGDDRVDGGDGADQLWGNAGADFILCGSGIDVAHSDATDRIFNDCESVQAGHHG